METENQPQSPNPAPPTLEYAKRTPLAWLSRNRRVLISLTLLLAIGGPTWWYWKPLKHRVLWLYWSRQAANHVMPAAAELLELDPTRARQLVATNPDYAAAAIWISTTQPNASGAAHFPKAISELGKVDPRLNAIVAAGVPVPPIALLGTLRRPDGTPSLVIIPRGGESYQGIDRLPMLVIPQPGWFDAVPAGPFSFRGYGYIGMGSGYIEELPLGPGKTDPADPSHLTIPYTIWKGYIRSPVRTELEKGTFDVYLQNDDSLLFRMRNDSTKSIALRLKKETVVSGNFAPPAAPATKRAAPAARASGNAPAPSPRRN